MAGKGSTGTAMTVVHTTNRNLTLLTRQPYPKPLQWDCINNLHLKGRPSVKQLAAIDGMWRTRGFAGPVPCCPAGASRMIGDLLEPGDLTKRERTKGARPT